MNELLCVLGLVLLLEGVPYFVAPHGMKKLLEQIPHIPETSLRWWGLIAMLAGLFLVYLGRR